MLFSWTVESLKPRSSAIEMTAAGIEVANVRPALRPKNTFAAVNTIVMITPRISPRSVISVRSSSPDFVVSVTGLSPGFVASIADIKRLNHGEHGEHGERQKASRGSRLK